MTLGTQKHINIGKSNTSIDLIFMMSPCDQVTVTFTYSVTDTPSVRPDRIWCTEVLPAVDIDRDGWRW
jgi:hypothetical protein